MANPFDVLLVGGGPAGCVTALLLARRGYSVAIVDRSSASSFQIGETLPPQAAQLLAELGLSEAFARQNHKPSPGILSAWGSSELHANDFIFGLHGSGWHIDRAAFNQMLADAAQGAGAVFLSEAHVKGCVEHNQGWLIHIEQAKRSIQLQSHFVVDAGGRASSCPAGFSRRIVYDRLIAVAGLSHPCRAASASDYTLVEAIDDGWFYSALLPCGEYIVAYMTDADLYAPRRDQSHWCFQSQLEKAPHTRSRVQSPSEHVMLFSAVTSIRDSSARRKWLAVGDAARSFDPLSAQGLWNAMRSGVEASRLIGRALGGDEICASDYEQTNRETFARYLRVHQMFYDLENRWPDSTFWARRQKQPMSPLNLRTA